MTYQAPVFCAFCLEGFPLQDGQHTTPSGLVPCAAGLTDAPAVQAAAELEHDRLSAEFKSPLTRDSQRFLGRRFRRASDAPRQVGMFEAPAPEPGQGRLF
jgi:hypothetical protein